MMLVQNVGMEIYFASKRSLLAAPYTGRKECEIRSYDTHRCTYPFPLPICLTTQHVQHITYIFNMIILAAG